MKLFWMLLFLTAIYSMVAPVEYSSQNKLKIIKTDSEYSKSIFNKPGFEMMDIKEKIPGIEFDLRYSSSNNFLHKKIYPDLSTTYLRQKAVATLMSVQNELKGKGLGLKIFDAYRPYTATQQIWQLVKDERYAANPVKGSNHNRGVAIDLTIITATSKIALDMGTDFDSFSDSAHHSFTSLPGEILRNRKLLRSVMTRHGFEAFETEWWHYTMPNAKKYEVMDLSFEQLKRITKHY